MEDELTSKMHSEFQIDDETDIKHKVWALLSMADHTKTSYQYWMDSYAVTEADVEKHRKSYLDLNK